MVRFRIIQVVFLLLVGVVNGSAKGTFPYRYGLQMIRGVEIKCLNDPMKIFSSEYPSYKFNRIGLTWETDSVFYSYIDSPEDIQWFEEFIMDRSWSGFAPRSPFNGMMFYDADLVHHSVKVNMPTIFRVNDVAMYAIIYFDDGRLPEIMWIGEEITFRDSVLSMSKEKFEELFAFFKKNKSATRRTDLIESWKKLDPASIPIAGFNVYITKKDPPMIFSRYEFFRALKGSNIQRYYVSRWESKDKCCEFFDILNGLTYHSTLTYDTSNLDIEGYIDNDGGLVWNTESHNTEVIGAIVILQNRTTTFGDSELIWIGKDYSVQRGYYRYKPSKRLKAFIESLMTE